MIDLVIKMRRKYGKPGISAIAIAVLFMAIAFAPGVSAKENLEANAITADRAADTDFSTLAAMLARVAHVLDNVASLPDMIYDYIEALFAVTLSEETITSMFTFVSAFIEYIIIMFVITIPVTIITMIIGYILAFACMFVGLLCLLCPVYPV